MKQRYQVTVYDGSDEPLWGAMGVDARSEAKARRLVFEALKDAVARRNTTIDLATVRFEVKRQR